jgi:hypothetical protein
MVWRHSEEDEIYISIQGVGIASFSIILQVVDSDSLKSMNAKQLVEVRA